MSYRVVLAPAAARYLSRLDRPTQAQIVERLEQLAGDPFSVAETKPLRSAGGLWSSRVRGWRILFDIDRAANTLVVTRIAPRGEVYRRLP